MRVRRPILVFTASLAVAAGAIVGASAPAWSAGSPPAMAIGHRTAAVSLVDTNPAETTPQVLDGQVEALAQVGDKIIVAGVFTQVRNPNTSAIILRTNVFAYDRLTGVVDTNFVPVVDGEVDALQAAPDGTSVFLGGLFKKVNTVQRAWAAKVTVATGQLVNAFTPFLNGRVSDFDLRGSTLYATGWFSTAANIAHGGLAALDVTTGLVSANLSLNLATTRTADGVRTVNVTPDQTRMVIAGNFTSVSGVARDQIAVIDLTTTPATVRADWNTSTLAFTCSTCTNSKIHTFVRDVAMSADGSYVVVGNTFYYPGNGDSAVRFEVRAAASDVAPTWIHYTGTDTITSVILTADGVAYIGGHFRWYPASQTGTVTGRVTRWGLAALDAENGMPYEWVPTRERGYGVLALLLDSSGNLVIGHDTDTVGGEKHSRLAMFPASPGHQVAASSPAALPVPVTRVSTTAGTQTTVNWSGTSVTGSTSAALPLPGFRAGVQIGRSLVEAADSGFYRLEANAYGNWTLLERLDIRGVNSANVTSMAFQNETLYYTLTNDSNLYALAYNSDSFLPDPFIKVVAGTSIGAGRDYRNAKGMFAAGGYLWVAWADGHLDRTPMPNGVLPDTSAAAVTVSSPAIDGQNWSTPLYVGAPPAATTYRKNLATAGVASQSTNAAGGGWLASAANDGNRDGFSTKAPISSTDSGTDQWWTVDLGSVQQINAIRIFPRTDTGGEWLASPWVFVSDTPFTTSTQDTTAALPGVTTYKINGIPAPGTEIAVGRTGRYVRLETGRMESLGIQLAEVEVLADPSALPPPPPPPALLNGGFENPVLSAGSYQYNAVATGWTFTGQSGVSTNNSGFTSQAPAAPEGLQVAFLQNLGYASQSATINVGNAITFSATQRRNGGFGSQSIAVYVDGVQQGGSITPPSGSWGTYRVPVSIATSGVHTVQLRGLTTPNFFTDRTAFVDAVTVGP